VSEWARQNGLDPTVARSWFRPGDPRKIPLAHAQRIRDEFDIPFSAWPKGVRK